MLLSTPDPDKSHLPYDKRQCEAFRHPAPAPLAHQDHPKWRATVMAATTVSHNSVCSSRAVTRPPAKECAPASARVLSRPLHA
jgi:hypothetical protein